MRRTSGRCSRRSCIRHWKSNLRSEGARVRKCDGPVRWSDGPVRWCDGPVRWCDGMTFGAPYLGPRTLGPSYRTTHAAPSSHRTASVSIERDGARVRSQITAPSPPRSIGPRAVQNAVVTHPHPHHQSGAGPPRPPRPPPPPNDGYGFGFTMSRSRNRSIDWAITSIASNAALSKA